VCVCVCECCGWWWLLVWFPFRPLCDSEVTYTGNGEPALRVEPFPGLVVLWVSVFPVWGGSFVVVCVPGGVVGDPDFRIPIYRGRGWLGLGVKLGKWGWLCAHACSMIACAHMI